MTDTEVTPSVHNARVAVLRFFFGMTCDREDMTKYIQFRAEPRKLPIVLSFEEVSAVLASAPGPGLKYRVALGVGYGAACFRGYQFDGSGYRQRPGADPCRARQRRQGSRSDAVTVFAGVPSRLLARGAPTGLAVSWAEPGRTLVAAFSEPGV